jgi:hypothetical protein
MSYLVFCTFDLKNASSQDYQNAYADLAAIGLRKIHTNSVGGQVVIPTTAAMGTFNGPTASAVCQDIRERVRATFTSRRLKSEIFVTTGGEDWAWSPATT